MTSKTGWDRLMRLSQALGAVGLLVTVPLVALGDPFGLMLGSVSLAGLWATTMLGRDSRRSRAPRAALARAEAPLHAETA